MKKRPRVEEDDLNNFRTLEDYKKFISRICIKAITYPEDDLESVDVLFKILNDECEIKPILKDYVKKITLLSLVSVVIHMLPRISYELSLEDDKSNLVNIESKITSLIINLRDKIVRYIKSNLKDNLNLYVTIIAKLTKADNKIYPDLFKLCIEYSKDSKSCHDALYDLFINGTFLDVSNYLNFIFKHHCYNHKVIKIINQINLNKKYVCLITSLFTQFSA